MLLLGRCVQCFVTFGALSYVHAVPLFTPRRNDPPAEHGIGDLVLDSWKHYFDVNGGLGDKVFSGLTSWRSISIDEDTSEEDYNQILFDIGDAVPSREVDSDGPAIVSFSQLFVNFVQNVTETLAAVQNEDPQQDDELDEAAEKQTVACEDVLGPGGLLDEAIMLYQVHLTLSRVFLLRGSLTKESNFTGWHDTKFIDWTQKDHNTTDFSPIKSCYDADNEYKFQYNKTYGRNFDLFAATSKAIQPLIDLQTSVTHGINMEIAEVTKSDLASSIQGNLVPSYSIPLLKGTLAAWLQLNMTEIAANVAALTSSASASPSATASASGSASHKSHSTSHSVSVDAKTILPRAAIPPAFEYDSSTSNQFNRRGVPAFEYDSTQSSNLKHRRSSPAFEYDSSQSLDLSSRFTAPRSWRIPFFGRAENTTEDAAKKKFQSANAIKKFTMSKHGKPQVGDSLQPITNATATSFKISYEQIKVVDINLDKWYDNGRSARAIRDADEDSDPQSAAAKPVFQQYFGSKKKPGDAAFHNVQALMVFHPSWEYTFASVEQAKSFDGSTSDETVVEGKKVTYKDSGNHAFVVGILQKSFWE